MRAVIIDAPASMQVGNVPDPTPRSDELLILVEACGICGTDLHIIDGESPLARYPIVPGHEFAGEVVALGGDIAQNFFFQAEDGIRDYKVTGVQTCALPI